MGGNLELGLYLNRARLLEIYKKVGHILFNKIYPKDLITVRIVATIIVLLSLIFPYFDLVSHSKTPFINLITLPEYQLITENNCFRIGAILE